MTGERARRCWARTPARGCRSRTRGASRARPWRWPGSGRSTPRPAARARASATRPRGVTCSGNFHPTPRNARACESVAAPPLPFAIVRSLPGARHRPDAHRPTDARPCPTFIANRRRPPDRARSAVVRPSVRTEPDPPSSMRTMRVNSRLQRHAVRLRGHQPRFFDRPTHFRTSPLPHFRTSALTSPPVAPRPRRRSRAAWWR